MTISLIEKPASYNVSLGITLFIAFCIIAFARLSKPTLFRDLFVSWTKIQNLNPFLKESMPLNKRASIFLIVNYFISGGVLLFLKLEEYNLDLISHIMFSLVAPISILLLGVIGILLTGWITGEYKTIRETMFMRFIGVEISGLLFFIGAIVWMLNVDLIQFVWQAMIVVFCFEFITRVFKSISVVYTNGVSWFYIILYLCTLEILPLFVAYYLVVKNFGLL